MRIPDMNLWIDASKTQSPAKYNELTFDYNWELKAVSEDMFKKNATKCKCRKPKCCTYIERRKMQGMRQRGQGLCECKSL
jgi:hypothetical protein